MIPPITLAIATIFEYGLNKIRRNFMIIKKEERPKIARREGREPANIFTKSNDNIFPNRCKHELDTPFFVSLSFHTDINCGGFFNVDATIAHAVNLFGNVRTFDVRLEII